MWVVYANYEDTGWFPIIRHGERWDALRYAQNLRVAVPKPWRTSLDLSIRWEDATLDPGHDVTHRAGSAPLMATGA